MRTNLYQSQQLRQELKMNPRLYQAMELLYMPLLDLQQHLKQELTENPFLELSEPDVGDEVPLEDGATASEEREDDDVDWEKILLDGFDAGGRRPQYEAREYYETPVVSARDLSDHLLDQLRMLSLSFRERLLGEEIIGNIGDDGYLTCSLEEVVGSLNEWLVQELERQRQQMGEAAARAEQTGEMAASGVSVDRSPHAADAAWGKELDKAPHPEVETAALGEPAAWVEGHSAHAEEEQYPPADPSAGTAPAATPEVAGPRAEDVSSYQTPQNDQEAPERLPLEPYTVPEAEQMLEAIQGFEPPGVGARDIRECVLIQLRRAGMEDTCVHTLVRDFFQDLVNHRWAEIARAMGIGVREVQDAADQIARFDPKPGLQYSAGEEEYVIPDLIVDKIDGEYMVFLNDTSLPRLRISRAYQEVVRNKDQFKGENKEFIANKLNAAQWMIQAIEQRRQTMLRVMSFIIDRQREFFEKGVQHLRPLTLREVADAIGMHESTISRVTNEKFVQTPRGVYPMKFFFSSGLSTTTGEDISARGVKDKISKLVDEEDPRRPLTDQGIVDILKGEGIEIARRTVAKYRDQLGILPARMRKRI